MAASAIVGWILSSPIHEFGHAIVAKMAGLQVVHLQPWAILGHAHIQLSGETTAAWSAAVNISGMLFTVLVGIVGVVTTVVVAQQLPKILLVTWLFVPMMCQSLAWFGLPLAIMFGADAATDDVTKFIHHAGLHPFAVAIIGLCLMTICTAVLMSAFRRAPANKDGSE